MTVIPLFPPGVHDIVVDPPNGGLCEVRCTGCDWSVPAHTDNDEEIRWAKGAGHLHAAKHRLGPCHEACYDEQGHTEGCLYEGDEG